MFVFNTLSFGKIFNKLSILAVVFLANLLAFAQNTPIKQTLTLFHTGEPQQRVEAAKTLSEYYQSESIDSLRIIGEDLFFFGIDNHYQPAIEYGKITLAEYYVMYGRCADGIDIAKELISSIQERGDFELLGNVYRIISSGYRKMGDANSALLWAKKAVETNQFIKNNQTPYSGLPLLAEAHFLKGNSKKAFEVYTKYIEALKKKKDSRRLSSAYARVGDMYRHKENALDLTENYFRLSFNEAVKTNLTSPVTHALNNLAITYFEKGDIEKAKEYFEKSMKFREKVNNPKFISESYYNMGEFYFYTDDFTKALTWYNKSIALAKKENLIQEWKDGILGLIKVYKAQKDFDNAFTSLEEVLQLDKKITEQRSKDDESLTNLQKEIWKSDYDLKLLNTPKEPNYMAYILGAGCIILCGMLFYLLYAQNKKNKLQND